MCGISGIINSSNNTVSNNEIETITRLVAHRGPDGEGFFHGSNFALGHRRLSILDLSESGRQPMNFGDLWMVFNGEIFNYLEIREELICLGYEFVTGTDTEVIMKAYMYWGEDCVTKFNGMWAFCIFDSHKNHLFCSRDRFGIKPFYYTSINGKFVFGSEIKQLLYFIEDRYINKSVLADFLVLSLEDNTNNTFFENVYKIPPSHNLIYNLETHDYQIHRYYEYHPEVSNDSEAHTIEKTFDLIKKSIDIRLRSDVKVGTCLSGGLDSSIIASIAAKNYDNSQAFYAVHAQSTEAKGDERVFADMVKESSQLDLTVIRPQKEDFEKNLQKVVEIQEEPFGGPSVIFQYFVFEQAKKDNCPVMLDGQGGDEVFLGYERYYSILLSSMTFSDKIKFLTEISTKSRFSFAKNLLLFAYFSIPFLRVSNYKKRLNFLKKDFLNNANFQYLIDYSKKFKDIRQFQKYELFEFQLPHLLRYEDKNSMYHSIETRLPFLDFDLVPYIINANNNLKMLGGWSKYILRKSCESVAPKEIIWRREKKGFEAPEDTWLKDKDKIINDIYESDLIKSLCKSKPDPNKIDNRTLWRLYSLKMWAETYNVKLN
jgi:asparagine synthase (glutamine-hydrolysing)